MIDILHQKPLLGRQINRAHPLAKGLVACWVFNEGSGEKAFDIASHKYDLDFNNGPIWTPGKNGHAILFDDGSSEHLQVNSTPVTAPPVTMSLWSKSDANDTSQVAMGLFDLSATNMMHRILIGNTGVSNIVRAQSVDGGGSGVADSTTEVTVNSWAHVCAIFGATNSRSIFLDGTDKQTETTNVDPTGIDRITIGRSGDFTPGSPFSGKIDLPMIWNRALTDDEVEWIFREPTAMFQQNRVRRFSVGAPPASSPGVVLLMDHFNGGFLNG